MEKSLLEHISESETLLNKISEVKEEYSELLKKKDNMQEECKHDIVVVSRIVSLGYSIKARCLLCGKNFTTPHELREIPNSHILEAWRLNAINILPCDELYNEITKKAKEFLTQNPDITSTELIENLDIYFS